MQAEVEPVKYRITYITQVHIDEWAVIATDGKVVSAGPMLKKYVGQTIHDIRKAKMVTSVKSAPPDPKPMVVLSGD